jgi:hypothetical protein
MCILCVHNDLDPEERRHQENESSIIFRNRIKSKRKMGNESIAHVMKSSALLGYLSYSPLLDGLGAHKVTDIPRAHTAVAAVCCCIT